MKKLGELIIEIIFPILTVMLTIAALLLIGKLVYITSNEAKMRKQAESIFHFNKNEYYIESYEYSGDQIIAIGVNGKEIIFPKNNTVIENIKGE